ncbi:MAG: glycerol kinase 5 [Promethearchaeota archaeon]
MKYILAIDSGGSGIKAILFDENGKIVERVRESTPPITNEPGAIEHDPQFLWKSLVSASKKVLEKKRIDPRDLASIGICNQRASFVLWDATTGEPLTNLISWADVRASKTLEVIKKNPKWKRLKSLSRFLSKLTNNTMLTATSLLEFTTDHASVRLKWLLDNNPDLKKKNKLGELKFGTLDSWFIYKLTGKEVHATDYTNAGATGLFNPFELKWNKIFMNLFDFNIEIFPTVKDSNGDFGVTSDEFFNGKAVPIRAVMGDQMAALFGQRCFQPGSVKISQGSGAFVDMNVGKKPKLSKRGLLPMISWSINGKVNYMLEGFVATAGTLIDWLGQGIGLSDTPKILNELAAQTNDTEGVIFVPTNAGIRFPYFNPNAKGCIFGLSLATHKRHVARAVLEGIALSIHEVVSGMENDTKIKIKNIKVDGGVSKSDILLQSLANFTNITVQRAPELDMTATGIAYMAGLGAKVWQNINEIEDLNMDYSTFEPKMSAEKRNEKLTAWKKAITAVLSLYK